MSFSDDDWKQYGMLMRSLYGSDNWFARCSARLEAAEKVCVEARFCQEEKFFSDELSDYFHAWRKAAGK